MGMIGWIFASLGAVFVAIFARISADEFKSWQPTLTKYLLHRAVSSLPDRFRDRLAEEWQRYVDDLPGDLSKVLCAASFNIASLKIKWNDFADRPNFVIDVSKRVFDIVVSIVTIPSYIPMFLILALIIRFHVGPGPVLVRNMRFGRGGKPFEAFSFRLSPYNLGAESEFKLSGFCNFLRRSQIEIIPYIINVLKGDMSMVGPRVVDFGYVDEDYFERHSYYFKAKPGIISPSSLVDPDKSTIEDEILEDIIYASKYSVAKDIVIIIKTSIYCFKYIPYMLRMLKK